MNNNCELNNFQLILNFIQKREEFKMLKKSSELNQTINRIRMITALDKTYGLKFNQDTLYFINDKDLTSFDYPDNLQLIILNTDKSQLPAMLCDHAALIILCSDESAFMNLYQYAEELRETAEKMNHFILQLAKNISENASLDDIVASISEIYQRPISIIDNAYSVMAFSSFCETDTHLIKEYRRGYLDEGAVAMLNRINFMTPLSKSTKIRYYDVDEEAGGNILGYSRNNYSLIYVNNVAMAAISVFDNYDISDCMLAFLEPISFMLSLHLQKQEFYMLNKGSYYNHLLSVITCGVPFNSEVMVSRLQSLGYTVKQYLYFMAVELNASDGKDLKAVSSIAEYVKNMIANSIYLILNNRILFLVSRDEPIQRSSILKWEKSIRSIHVLLGISNAFEDLNASQQYIQEANSAIEMGTQIHPEQCIYIFDDYQIYAASKYLLEAGKSELVLYPPLMKLIEYDKKHKTNLTETLQEYLVNPKKPLEVCDKLFIHKNTLYYRLDKIRNIIGADFESVEQVTKINLSLKMLKYREKSNG